LLAGEVGDMAGVVIGVMVVEWGWGWVWWLRADKAGVDVEEVNVVALGGRLMAERMLLLPLAVKGV
jgi:hypothetical protein